MARSHEPLKGGYDVDENAVRFSNYFHVLRELVHLCCGWLPLEPRLEVKYAARRPPARRRARGDEDQAPPLRAAHAERLPRRALPTSSPRCSTAPAPRRPRAEYLEIAYGELKPTLIAAVRIHLDHARPAASTSRRCACSPSSCTARSATSPSCPPSRASPPFDDLGALPIRLREVRELTVMPPLDQPARDDYVEVTEEGDTYLTDELYVNGDENHVPTDPEEQKHFFHGLMDAELCAAELMARNSHEHPEMPWDFHVDMARQTWDEIRHAEVHDALMATELGCHWGDYPVGFGYFKSVYAYDLLGRLALFNGTSEQKAMWRHSHRRKVLIELGQATVARVFDYLLADEVPHVHNGERWGTHLLGGDEAAYREKVRELRAGLDATGQPVAS